MLANREMVNFSKMELLSIFRHTITINFVTTGVRKIPIECMFCFICSEKYIQIISLRKKCGLFSSVLKENHS